MKLKIYIPKYNFKERKLKIKMMITEYYISTLFESGLNPKDPRRTQHVLNRNIRHNKYVIKTYY